MTISTNIALINERIRVAAETAGRNPVSVRLVAVSKTRPAADISAAFRAGQSVFGENYIQELVPKLAEVPEDVQWHFIGHLQSNKVKYIAGRVALIHSVDRISLAQEIDRQWGRLRKVCDVLIQVNISGEATKSGTTDAGAIQLVRECALLPNISVKGLMTMPPFFDDPDAARPYFTELRRLAETISALQLDGVEMKELSMGMSGDFETAIQEGATLVRVGTAIFGSR
ncbi:MAG: YggS family pyridoxal phosphate-dependent enzyme [Desulfuromonadaceae bacterium]|nr:YggS family pyridoxal phosphate-dependent enzyme [Desulfuromonadaceae bacterium]MDD2848440.1 YggS family pyridoxal phosphate-dependent enzyme [Desulfuromonadaceae bacterium]MDD4129931.1 YggS family pyridoxal phosphate-dependent enzyme [Desulfuromonadaceae bacterium]